MDVLLIENITFWNIHNCGNVREMSNLMSSTLASRLLVDTSGEPVQINEYNVLLYNWYMHTKMQQCMQGCNLLIIRFLWAVSFDIILHMQKKIIAANNLNAITIIFFFFTKLIQKIKITPHRTKWITVPFLIRAL